MHLAVNHDDAHKNSADYFVGRQTCRYLADTVASLTFLGMHAEPADEVYQPTFYAEASRRVLLAVFTVDKV